MNIHITHDLILLFPLNAKKEFHLIFGSHTDNYKRVLTLPNSITRYNIIITIKWKESRKWKERKKNQNKIIKRKHKRELRQWNRKNHFGRSKKTSSLFDILQKSFLASNLCVYKRNTHDKLIRLPRKIDCEYMCSAKFLFSFDHSNDISLFCFFLSFPSLRFFYALCTSYYFDLS